MQNLDHRSAFHCLLHDMANRVSGVSMILGLMSEDEHGLSAEGREMLTTAVGAADLLHDCVVDTRELSVRLERTAASGTVPVTVRTLLAEAQEIAGPCAVTVVGTVSLLDRVVVVEAHALAAILGVLIRQYGRDGRAVEAHLLNEGTVIRLEIRGTHQAMPSHVVRHFADRIAPADGTRGMPATAPNASGLAIRLPLASL